MRSHWGFEFVGGKNLFYERGTSSFGCVSNGNSVVLEFIDVFKNFSGLPLGIAVKFFDDIIAGNAPISKTNIGWSNKARRNENLVG